MLHDDAIDALSKFARVVSDAPDGRQVLELLADALLDHVCPDGVAIFRLGRDGTLRLVVERRLGAAKELAIEIDAIETLPDKVMAAVGRPGPRFVSRPLVAGASLYGSVVMMCADEAAVDSKLGDTLVDLAATALSTAAHVDQLERQFAELHAQQLLLARTEALRVLGQMAAGFSHDLRNILSPLSLHLQRVPMLLDRGEVDAARASAAEMMTVLNRALQALGRLRDFSRPSDDAKTERVDLDGLVREAAAIGKSRCATSGRDLPSIHYELRSPHPVMAVSSDVLSALVNLIVNAIDALGPHRGKITLRSGETDHGPWVEVEDDGPGMPPEIAQHVFEPFFTTKGDEGTGLGLAMVQATMMRHRGSVKVMTAPGRGAAFRLSFPSARHVGCEVAAARAKRAAPNATPGGSVRLRRIRAAAGR